MSQFINWLREVNGENTLSLVRIKPPMNFQKEDVRIINNNIILSDPITNRIIQEFPIENAFTDQFTLQQIYEAKLVNYISYILRGFNVLVFAYGSTGAGKTQTIEGNKKEQGLIILFASSLFGSLENKKLQINSDNSQTMVNYSYQVRIQYVEIIDENFSDLLAEKRFGNQLHIEEDAWEGPIIQNANWEFVISDEQVIEKLAKGARNRDNTSNEFGKLSSKATSLFIFEIKQTYNNKDTNEPILIKSRLVFIDLPGSEIFIENTQAEEARIRQGSTLNKVILAFTQLIKDLSDREQKQKTNQLDFIMYDTSTVTTLGKEAIGNNSFNVGIFCLQHSDHKGNSITLNTFKQFRNIVSYPVINSDKVLAVFHQFRQEVQSQKTSDMSSKKQSNSSEGGGLNQILDLKKQVNDNQKYITDLDDENQKLRAKLSDLRQKYQDLVKQKSELQAELIKSEEDKLEYSKALVEMEMENARIMDLLQKEKFNQQNKLVNEDTDILSANLREEKALETIRELQERLKQVIDDKRELDMEFMVLKKNYMEKVDELEKERLKQENFSLELINVMNENKALQEEISNLYKSSGSKSEENQRFINRIEQLEMQLRERDESLIFTKAEIERLKTEMMRYEVQGKQGKLDEDKKKLEVDKQLFENGKGKDNFSIVMQKESDDILRKNKDERMMWESQRMELMHKVKTLTRRIGDENDRIKELEKQLQEMMGENQKMQLQLDEMRSIYRNKLIQFTSDAVKKPQNELNAREELIKNYTEKESELHQLNSKLKSQLNQGKLEIKALRSYARNLRYLAEDWAPLTEPIPDILSKEPPYMVTEEENIGSLQSDLQSEIERLRSRNRRLEEELQKLSNQVKVNSEKDINRRLMSEIEQLNTTTKRPSSSVNDEQLRKERNELQEENRRLVQMLKDSKKWDVLQIQRENERLIKIVKELESGNQQIGPTSGYSKAAQQKITFFEQLTKSLEKERTELLVRSTMAEEQLKTMQESLSRVTSDYQKKIIELKRQLQARQI